VAVGAAIGGTASRITGGKFANGALTGAFSQALNNERAEAARLEARIDQVVAAVAADYGDVLEAGNIDLKANITQARNMSPWEFAMRLSPGEDWDYKKMGALRDSGIADAKIAEFGNLHYGIVAAASGYSLPVTLSAAGAVQNFMQQGGSLRELIMPYLAPLPRSMRAAAGHPAHPMLSREGAIRWVESGRTFGDLPDDPRAIIRGWDLYHDR
ncbi:MAG: polymorphic toxin type 44 domain-containing protein, partial [Gammaproteobacteria bacterium]|nr:polymorphic toxin type 44 domain-containing protein [Gammaproteobacteria bacterium]